MSPSSLRFKAKIKNDKWKLRLSHHDHRRHQGFSQIYPNIMKYMDTLFFSRAVYWEHKVEYTGTLNSALRSFRTWDAIWRTKKQRFTNEERMKYEQGKSDFRFDIWNIIVTLMDCKAKYSFPRSDVVFLLSLIHDKKLIFFKFLPSNYFTLTCNYLEIMYKENGSST